MDGVHAMTDVTGFGLAGHLLEICRGSGLSAQVELASLPLIDSAVQWAREGVATGASGRNWAAYGSDVDWPADAPEWQRTLCTDPQTSGGLLVSCAASAAPAVLQAFQSSGFAQAAVVGRMQACEHNRGSRLAFA
jgi:selenide,water dikinase